MHKTAPETANFLQELITNLPTNDAEVVVAPTFVNLTEAVTLTKNTKIVVAAQNMHQAEAGAYTGEISANMLTAIGVNTVILGHSERRQYFGETDATVNQRVKAALAKGLKPIICVGETLEQREKNRVKSVLKKQTDGALAGLTKEDLANVVIAYEPIWAIGTGKTATAQDANDTIKIIRNRVAKLYDRKTANKLRIQYGGSMNAKNAAELMAMPQIDGGLIGGASLKAVDFSIVVKH